MRALILAGGKGSRLRPFTFTIPKPLVPIGEMSILEILIRQLKGQGFERITLSVGHMAGLIRRLSQNVNDLKNVVREPVLRAVGLLRDMSQREAFVQRLLICDAACIGKHISALERGRRRHPRVHLPGRDHRAGRGHALDGEEDGRRLADLQRVRGGQDAPL